MYGCQQIICVKMEKMLVVTVKQSGSKFMIEKYFRKGYHFMVSDNNNLAITTFEKHSATCIIIKDYIAAQKFNKVVVIMRNF